MSDVVYRELLDVMIKRRGAYAGMDIPEFFAMVKEMFTPQEAAVNNAMPRGPFTAQNLAETMNRNPSEVESTLEGMANKGLCMAVNVSGVQYYQSARFMPGILEFQFMPGTETERDRKLARLIHEYKKAYDAAHPPEDDGFPTSRVITVDRTIESGNQVHTYDQVQTYIDRNEHIALTACYCRHAAKLRGEDLHDMPLDTCMQFGMGAVFAIERLGGRRLTREEARDVLNRAEEAGLIHMSMNMAADIEFICNCDRWHCTPVRDALRHAKPALHFNSGFDPKFDPDECTACETCIERCPPEALVLGEDDVPLVNLDLCFGCAVCATGCPSEAITMVSKTGFPEPPADAQAMKEALRAARARQS